MTNPVDHFRALGLRCRPVPAGDGRALDDVSAGRAGGPFVLRGAARAWPALHAWTRERLLARHGDARVRPAFGLPAHGVPYLVPEAGVRREVSLRAFWEELDARGGCYLDQLPLDALPGLRDDLRLDELLRGARCDELNLWIGRHTRSGLHVDSADNFVVMIHGEKTCALAPLAEAPRLDPFEDAVTKSRVDLEAPDLARAPALAAVDFRAVTLAAGDVLFIPRGWWHYLRSPREGHQVSVNAWFDEAPARVYAALFAALGPRFARRAARDLIHHGALGRPHPRFNHRARPDGAVAWELLRGLAVRLRP
jgi:hypothetical protein